MAYKENSMDIMDAIMKEMVELRQQLKRAFEEQKQAEGTRDEAEMRVLEVRGPRFGEDSGG